MGVNRVVVIAAADVVAANKALQDINGPDTFVPFQTNEDGTPTRGTVYVCGYTVGTLPYRVEDSVPARTVYNDKPQAEIRAAETVAKLRER